MSVFPSSRLDAIWARKADQLGALHRAGRRPERCAPDADERALYTWHTRNRIYAERGTLTAERHAYLDAHVSGWDKGNLASVIGTASDPWACNVERLRDFVTANGRMPFSYASDPVEARIGGWVKSTRARELDPARRAYLDAAVPGWADTRSMSEVWERHAQDLGAFAREHGRWPKRAPVSEKKLAIFLDTCRTAYRGGDMPIDRLARLNELAPGWDTPLTKR